MKKINQKENVLFGMTLILMLGVLILAVLFKGNFGVALSKELTPIIPYGITYFILSAFYWIVVTYIFIFWFKSTRKFIERICRNKKPND